MLQLRFCGPVARLSARGSWPQGYLEAICNQLVAGDDHSLSFTYQGLSRSHSCNASFGHCKLIAATDIWYYRASFGLLRPKVNGAAARCNSLISSSCIRRGQMHVGKTLRQFSTTSTPQESQQGMGHYPDGTVDEGELTNGKLEGLGKRTFPDGRRLTGEFKDGKPFNCKGVFHDSSGDIDEGIWVNGHLNGEGKRTYADGATITGEFRKGRLYNGAGIARHPDGVEEEGVFCNGYLEGQGRRSYGDGRKEEGAFYKGELNGYGVVSYHDGLKLEGEFSEGKIFNGKGSFRHPIEGTVQEGEWVEGHLTGEGKCTYPDHIVYAGTFQRGLLHGRGTVTHPKGYQLRGEFREGQIFTGKGALCHDDGTVEEGEWVEGNRTHLNRIIQPDGTVLEGSFHEGHLHGQGVVTHPDGHCLKGEFREGMIFTCKGSVRYPDGRIDEGEWKQGHLTGEGKRTYPDGTQHVGTFLKGKPHGHVRTTHPDGHCFEGKYMHGHMWNGQGLRRLTDGSTEEGVRKEGALIGKVVSADGTVRIGTFVDGKQCGQGVFTSELGTKLKGEFRDGRFYNGKGLLRIPAGQHYISLKGEWVDGFLTGSGKRRFADGTKHVGIFHKGRLHGHGVVMHPDGHRLEGEFREGEPYNCKGALRHSDGTVEEGEWVVGHLTGPGKRLLQDDEEQVGAFQKGCLHGHGVVTYPGGYRLEGEFREGRIYNGSGSLYEAVSGILKVGRWSRGQFRGKIRQVEREESNVGAGDPYTDGADVENDMTDDGNAFMTDDGNAFS